MPIEIRELVIRTRVEEPEAPARPQASGARTPAGPLNNQDLEKIISICLERIMDMLKQQNER